MIHLAAKDNNLYNLSSKTACGLETGNAGDSLLWRNAFQSKINSGNIDSLCPKCVAIISKKRKIDRLSDSVIENLKDNLGLLECAIETLYLREPFPLFLYLSEISDENLITIGKYDTDIAELKKILSEMDEDLAKDIKQKRQ